jgi:DNA-binding FrmR family transcriptional regulator
MLNQRINRIIGQLKGIQRMIDERRDCQEVLQQIFAVKKAIDGLSKEIAVTSVTEYASSNNFNKIAQIVERVVNL